LSFEAKRLKKQIQDKSEQEGDKQHEIKKKQKKNECREKGALLVGGKGECKGEKDS
jgi:hypothetical protein